MCNNDAKQVSPGGVTRWISCFYRHWDCCECCRSRKRFYSSWNLSRNESSKKFHETDHVTWCNACWNLFRIVVAHKFQLKVSTCNSGFTASYRSFILVVITRQMFYHFRVCCTSICSDQVFWAIEKHGHWKSDFENWLFCFGNNRWNAIKQHGQSVRIGDQWLGWYKC